MNKERKKRTIVIKSKESCIASLLANIIISPAEPEETLKVHEL